MKRIFSLFLIYFVLISCQKDEIFVYSAHSNLKPYVDRFYEEAEKRGIVLQKSNLIVEFAKEQTDQFCGKCLRKGDITQGQRTVQIVNTSSCWSSKLDINKEALIFHELGHCLLDREHLDEFFEDGSPTSLMTTFEENPYSSCLYVFDGGNNADEAECNKLKRRDYYLDELFGISSANPFWLKN